MEGEISLQINLNLQKLSMISVATSLWQASDIKQEIENLFTKSRSHLVRPNLERFQPARRDEAVRVVSTHSVRAQRYREFDEYAPYSDCYSVAQKVIQNKNFLPLPEMTSKNLEQVIIYVGENLFDWMEYVTGVMGLSLTHTEEIYWTCTGRIDEEKIYHSFWKRIGALELKNNSYFKNNDNSMYVLASIYADVTFLQNSTIDITFKLGALYPNVNIDNYHDKIYTFMTLWLYYNFKDQLPRFSRVSFYRSGYIILPEVMLILCCELKLNTAAKYYFSKLNINAQQQSALDRARTVCLQNSRMFREIRHRAPLTYYEVKTSSDMIIFYMKNMENEQRRIFVNEYHPQIIEALLYFWLFPELAMSFFNLTWPEVQGEDVLIDHGYSNLLGSIAIHIKEDLKANCPVKKDLFNTALYRVWDKIPSNLKSRVIRASKTLSKGFIKIMLIVFDLDFVRHLLNDPDVTDQVDYIIARVADKFHFLNEGGEYDLIYQLIIDVVPTVRWDDFLKDTRFLELLIKKDEFDEVEEFLNILAIRHGTKTKSEIKSEINGARICHELIDKGEFDLVNKYINWQFETEEERKTFRDELKSNTEVIQRIIHNIWRNKRLSREEIKKRCFECLMFYCESNEEEVMAIRKENKFDLLEDDNWRNLILGL